MQQVPSGQAKRKEIEKLLHQLNGDLSNEVKSSLERLKILGRDPRDADALFTTKGINILLKHGLEADSTAEASREALSCLANCMLLQPSTRSLTVNLGAAPKIADKYQHVEHHADEFLCARLLLVMTYGTSCDFQDLIIDHELCQSINRCLENRSKNTDELAASGTVPSSSMALAETLKLLFSLTKRCPDDVKFHAATQPAIDILLSQQDHPEQAIEPVVTHLVDALHILPIEEEDLSPWFPASDPKQLVERLISMLRTAAANHEASEMDLKAATTVILLLRLHKHAPDDVKALMREELLPSEDERNKPLGQSNTLPARLLRLSTSGYTPQLRELIPELFFELSDRNAETFVNNVGYGYASGYLTNNKIPFVPPSGESSKEAGARNASGMRTDVNPVTGQFLANEPKIEGPPMTEEEKMREAERLFVLFERLKKTGVVDVKNPAEDAVQSGRFEELDDD